MEEYLDDEYQCRFCHVWHHVSTMQDDMDETPSGGYVRWWSCRSDDVCIAYVTLESVLTDNAMAHTEGCACRACRYFSKLGS